MSAAVSPLQLLRLALDSRHAECGAIATQALRAKNVTPAAAARLWSALAFNRVLGGSFARAVRSAARASAAAAQTEDAGARAIAAAMVSLVAAMVGPGIAEPGGEPWPLSIDEILDSLSALEPEDRAIAGYLVTEAAMSAGRLVDAQRLAEAYGTTAHDAAASEDAAFEGATDIALVRIVTRIALARSLAFQGSIAAATATARTAVVEAERLGANSALMLARATLAYCAAQGGHRAEVERETAIVGSRARSPQSYLEIGSHVLCSFALAAVGEVARAGELMLSAAGGPRLDRLQVVDRAYGYEILAAAAIEAGDLGAARAWGRRTVVLQTHDMAVAAVERTLSRIDIAAGDSESAAERAAVSAARALLAGGRLDATRSRVLEALAHAASGSREIAVTAFNEAAAEADELGATAIRSWSARELRRLGRRLTPRAGAGWAALSEREQQIALLAAEGYSNRMIGRALYLSERTVQSHISRVLATLGAGSRSGIPAALGRAVTTVELPRLTERQWQIAAMIAEGMPNREIAERLEISQKTVEKHVQGIFERWDVGSRTGIARLVLSDRASLTNETSADDEVAV